MRNFMGYDRHWLDEPHVGDHVGRSIWALGEVLATAWVPAVAGPTERLLNTIVQTLPETVSLRTGAYAALGLAHLDTDRRGPGAQVLLERVMEQLSAAYSSQRGRGLGVVRGQAHLRQRTTPARADRRRRCARPERSDRDRARRASLAR